MILATYIHDLDPVLVKIWGPLQVRWYGLSYLAAFVAGYFILRSLARRRLWVVGEEATADFLTWAAVFGVFLGGRLGHVLFYTVADKGWGPVLEDPLMVIRVWDGGMASHGGILGLFLFTLWYAWRRKLSWPGVGDGLVVAAPLGLFFGRMANFINGELYGRPAGEGVSWAVKFPAAFFEQPEEGGRLAEAVAAAKGIDPQVTSRNLVEAMRENEAAREAAGEFLLARHPSQIYEGVLEGLVLFAILWTIRVVWKKAPHGFLTGAFFIFYAVFRIFVENYRMPDAKLVLGGAMTKGQFYSVFMVAIGLAFWAWAFFGKGRGKGKGLV